LISNFNFDFILFTGEFESTRLSYASFGQTSTVSNLWYNVRYFPSVVFWHEMLTM